MTDQTIAFCDVETTTDDPLTGQVWEIGLIIREPGQDDVEYSWLVDPGPLDGAQRTALRMTDYFERTSHLKPHDYQHSPIAKEQCPDRWDDPVEVAAAVAKLTANAIFVCNNTTFDGPYLDKFLRRFGLIGAWDYRHRDIGSIYDGWHAGWRAAHDIFVSVLAEIAPGEIRRVTELVPKWTPPGMRNIAIAMGLDPEAYDSHVALPDARIVRDCWDQIFADGFRCP